MAAIRAGTISSEREVQRRLAPLGTCYDFLMAGAKTLAVGDRRLVQIVDAALADSARRSGPWLACRIGCTQCCIGVFPIDQLDVVRLQRGLAELERHDPARASRVRKRSHEAVRRLRAGFPGDASTGILAKGDSDFEEFANDEPCPVLDPETGRCDLYTARPMTCRVFGPPVRSEGGLGVCELCFQGATEKQIAACELHLDAGDLERELLAQAEASTGRHGETLVAFALR